MTESITNNDDLTAEDEFDGRTQPGRLLSTVELDMILQDVNKEHKSFCRWNPDLEDQCEPSTWHQNVCTDDIGSLNGHGYLDEMLQSPEALQKEHEEQGLEEPAVTYGYLAAVGSFYLLRETRALRDEQAARHEEAMAVQRQIVEELKRRWTESQGSQSAPQMKA